MKLRRLRKDTLSGYTTFGCMWQKGECTEQTAYRCVGSDGGNVPVQSRITAYWPDGSVKWTAHTAESALLGEEIEVIPEESNTPCMAADRGTEYIRIKGRLPPEAGPCCSWKSQYRQTGMRQR